MWFTTKCNNTLLKSIISNSQGFVIYFFEYLIPKLFKTWLQIAFFKDDSDWKIIYTHKHMLFRLFNGVARSSNDDNSNALLLVTQSKIAFRIQARMPLQKSPTFRPCRSVLQTKYSWEMVFSRMILRKDVLY
jgi:hypothetical protein